MTYPIIEFNNFKVTALKKLLKFFSLSSSAKNVIYKYMLVIGNHSFSLFHFTCYTLKEEKNWSCKRFYISQSTKYPNSTELQLFTNPLSNKILFWLQSVF